MNAGNEIRTNLASTIGETTRAVASAGLTVQNYCVTVQQQPLLLIPEDLQKKLPDVNAYLKDARENAGTYLNTVQPLIIGTIADVGAFSTQFPMLAQSINGYIQAWSSGSEDNKMKALTAIDVLQDMVGKKVSYVQTVCGNIGSVEQKVNDDVSNFETVSQACGSLITGDHGELNEIKKQIKSLDGKIVGASVGVGLSGLAVIGGVFMVLCGAVASFFTAGTSTSLVVWGSILAGSGVAGLVGASVALASLVKQKGSLLRREAALNTYVSVLDGCKSSVVLLSSGAREASQKLTIMKNSWEFLSSDLSKVKEALVNAQTYSVLPSVVQDFFVSAVDQWKGVDQDIKTIKNQMTGVEIKQMPTTKNARLLAAPAGETQGQFNEDAVRRMLA